MKRVFVLLLLVSALMMGQAPRKKRVAVMNFDYGTVSSNVQAFFQTNYDVGKGLADLIVDRLVKDGTYSVIERKMLDTVLAEQNFSNSDRADPNSAAKIGKVLGVDAIIVGSITQFGRDDKSVGVGGGAYGLGKYGLGGIGKKNSKAVVALTARIINIDTAEILVSAQGRGESARGGFSLGGAGGTWSGGGSGNIDLASSNFGETILGEATYKAVDQLKDELINGADRIETHAVTLSGLVADVSGNTLILNVGSSKGVHVGDRFQVSRVGRTITDPATGKVIKRVETPIGMATVTEVDAESSTATLSGGAAKVGDTVKP